MIHIFTCQEKYILAIKEGRKTFEARKPKKKYPVMVGDELLLKQPDGGQQVQVEVTYVIHISEVERLYGMEPGNNLEVYGLKLKEVGGC